MAKYIFPDPRFRSPTAVKDVSNMYDSNVYSALVLTDGATGSATAFSAARGQAIPVLGTSSAAAAHQQKYTETTTNISQNGQLGSAIGEASFRAVGIDIEAAGYVEGTGVINTYGASQQEFQEILAKTSFLLRVSGKKFIEGPTRYFPGVGGAMGSLATTEATLSQSAMTNGWPTGVARKLRLPVLASRTDTIEGIFTVTGGASLTFRTANAAPCLVWFNLHALVSGDAR